MTSALIWGTTTYCASHHAEHPYSMKRKQSLFRNQEIFLKITQAPGSLSNLMLVHHSNGCSFLLTEIPPGREPQEAEEPTAKPAKKQTDRDHPGRTCRGHHGFCQCREGEGVNTEGLWAFPLKCKHSTEVLSSFLVSPDANL